VWNEGRKEGRKVWGRKEERGHMEGLNGRANRPKRRKEGRKE
jgi:hypothetical protein